MTGTMNSALDEEKVILQAMGVCKRYLRPDVPGGNLQGCLDMELEEVRACYRTSVGKGRYDTLTRQELAVMEQVLAYFEPILRERTTAIRDRMLRDDTVRKINFASTEAVIRSRLEAVGLKVRISSQPHRAAVHVPLEGNTWFRFYVPYKKAADPEYMDGTVEAVLHLREAILRLGLDTRIKRI